MRSMALIHMPDAAAEAEIRTIVADQVVAWNAGDGKGYARRLAPEASFTNLFGMVMYGAPAFEQWWIEARYTTSTSNSPPH